MYNNANDESLTSDADLDSIQKNIAVHMRAILRELRIDTDNDPNSRETAERVAKMYTREIFTGRFSTPPKIASRSDGCYGPVNRQELLLSSLYADSRPVLGWVHT